MWRYSVASVQKHRRTLAKEGHGDKQCKCGRKIAKHSVGMFWNERSCFSGVNMPPPHQCFIPSCSPLISPLWTLCAAIHCSTSLTSISVNRTSKARELDGEWQCLQLVCRRRRLLQSVRLRPASKCLSGLKAIVLSDLRPLPSSPSLSLWHFFLCYNSLQANTATCWIWRKADSTWFYFKITKWFGLYSVLVSLQSDFFFFFFLNL